MKGCNSSQMNPELFRSYISSMDEGTLRSIYENFNKTKPMENNDSIEDNLMTNKNKSDIIEEIQPCPSNEENEYYFYYY